LPGVYSTTSGYTAGQVENPTYKAVSRGSTGHTEAVQIVYDPKKISYAELLKVFWRNIDPLAKNRQFCDGGTQYRSGIYYIDDEQKGLALKSLEEIKGLISGTIHTEIEAAQAFYLAEEYHQDFYKKKPGHYERYRKGCGRDRRLEQLWGKAK
jgi:peptide-methionine (S)-S-oxide reductase